MRFRATVMCVGLAALLGAAPAPAAPSAKEIKAASRHASKGDRAMKSGDLSHAKESYKKALDEAPGFPGALMGLGQVALGEGDFAGALDLFQQAKGEFSTYGDAMLELQARRYAEAQKQINQLQDSIQQLQSPGNSQQDASIRISQLTNQISQLQGIDVPSGDASHEPPGELDFYIGNALFRLQRLDEAVAAWETCRDKRPTFAMVYNNLALGYGHLGRIDEALASLDKADELGFPVNPKFREDLQKLAK